MKYLSPITYHLSPERGFTLPELVVVMGLALTFLGLATINLLNSQHQTSLSSTLDVLLADMKEQQIKAMIGETEGRSTADRYGVHFTTSSYTLFHGTYDSSSSTNFVVTLPSILQFASINLPNSEIVFQRGTGEVLGYSAASNSFVLQDSGGINRKTVIINRYGVVTGVN